MPEHWVSFGLLLRSYPTTPEPAVQQLIRILEETAADLVAKDPHLRLID
ncbi:MAG: hypothetical protein AAF637_06570 [Pseudomonadota bacterium]